MNNFDWCLRRGWPRSRSGATVAHCQCAALKVSSSTAARPPCIPLALSPCATPARRPRLRVGCAPRNTIPTFNVDVVGVSQPSVRYYVTTKVRPEESSPAAADGLPPLSLGPSSQIRARRRRRRRRGRRLCTNYDRRRHGRRPGPPRRRR